MPVTFEDLRDAEECARGCCELVAVVTTPDRFWIDAAPDDVARQEGVVRYWRDVSSAAARSVYELNDVLRVIETAIVGSASDATRNPYRIGYDDDAQSSVTALSAHRLALRIPELLVRACDAILALSDSGLGFENNVRHELSDLRSCNYRELQLAIAAENRIAARFLLDYSTAGDVLTRRPPFGGDNSGLPERLPGVLGEEELGRADVRMLSCIAANPGLTGPNVLGALCLAIDGGSHHNRLGRLGRLGLIENEGQGYHVTAAGDGALLDAYGYQSSSRTTGTYRLKNGSKNGNSQTWEARPESTPDGGRTVTGRRENARLSGGLRHGDDDGEGNDENGQQ